MENLILSLYLVSLLSYLFSRFPKYRSLSLSGLTFLIFGLSGNIYLIISHLYHTQRLPLTNTPETMLSLVAILGSVYLILEYKLRLPKLIGSLVSLSSLLGLYLAFYIFKKPFMPLLPALQSKWLAFHVLSCIIAYSFFTIAFIAAMVYIFRKERGLGILATMHRSIWLGFFFLTSGIILGSIWGKSAWGHWWSWDPKETWALIAWLIYASYIHSCLLGSRPEKKLVAIAILGFPVCLFTYLGVNFLLKGLHSYA